MKDFGAALLSVGLIVAVCGAASAQDAAKGKSTFNQCMACHRIGPDAKSLVGPPLTDVIGRKAGTYPGFSYSALMKNAGDAGLVWTDAEVQAYLVSPSSYLKKYLTDHGKSDQATGASKMVYMLANEDQRKNVVAYLETTTKK